MESYYHALLAPEAKICGTRLGNYTLWHHALLSALGSPFLDAEGTVDAPDLLLAVQVCRPRWPRRPRTRISAHSVLWRRLLRNRDRLHYHAAAFGGWLDAHMAGPMFFRDTTKTGGGLSAPETLGLVYGLTSLAKISQEEAWETSPGLAQYILGAVAELKGAELTFADPEELTDEAAPRPLTERAEVQARAEIDLGPEGARRFMEAWDARQQRAS